MLFAACAALAVLLGAILYQSFGWHSRAYETRDRYGVVNQCALRAEDFIENLPQGAAVTMARPYDASKPGRQTIRLTVQNGKRKTRHSATLRLLRLRSLRYELGTVPDPFPVDLIFNERGLEGIPMAFREPVKLPASPGSADAAVVLDGQEFSLLLYAQDTTPPRADPRNMESQLGMHVPPEAFAQNITDATRVTARYVEEPDFTRLGRQNVTIELEDEGGNKTTLRARLRLEGVPDTEPPVIHGVQDIHVGLLGTVAYRKGVTVTDNSGSATLEVDSSRVNTGVPGEYTVTYTAIDPSGNTTTATATVYVSSISEAEVAEMADKVLDSIIEPGMTDRDKAYAIHQWVKNYIVYQNKDEKNGVIEGAYHGLATRRGDCYTYYALAKYLLLRVGIEDVIDLQREESEDPEAETHYWLLVNLGEGWYHYDATPVRSQYQPHDGFMMTDSEAQTFAKNWARDGSLADYYSYRKELIPEGVVIVP